nr:MAG TPA: hypothetical protein [Caudoviricetes sp.]
MAKLVSKLIYGHIWIMQSSGSKKNCACGFKTLRIILRTHDHRNGTAKGDRFHAKPIIKDVIYIIQG